MGANQQQGDPAMARYDAAMSRYEQQREEVDRLGEEMERGATALDDWIRTRLGPFSSRPNLELVRLQAEQRSRIKACVNAVRIEALCARRAMAVLLDDEARYDPSGIPAPNLELLLG